MAISTDYLQELNQRTDIVELVGSYLQLRRSGRTYTGLCPFHSEKTPSFFVYPETSSFYCFGCGVGGDAITFVKRMNNLDYPEAVRFLAARAGMPMPDDRDDAGQLKRRILAMNKETARFYFSCLNAEGGRAARRYLRGRALSDGTIKRFGLGYAPPGFEDTKNFLLSKGFTEEEMLAGGVVRRGQRGGSYDFFRDRVIFPIIDLRGNVIAFGGRRMGEEGGPKYLNSSDSPVFKKSRNMFAMNVAKRSRGKRYLLCEGYMDAIALHQAGFDTAVAPLGTAFTQEQAKLLATYAQEVVLCYDSDEAGQKATRRAISLLENEPLKVSILTVQGAKDPDEFIKKYGAERFQLLLDGCSNAIEYELARARANYDLSRPDGRVGYLRDGIEILSGRVSPTQREVYAGRLAEETDVEKKTVMTQLEARVRARGRAAARQREKKLLDEGAAAQISVPYSAGGRKALGVAFAEQQLMAAALRSPDQLKLIAARLRPEQFITPEMGQVFALLLERQAAGDYPDLTQLGQLLPEGTIALLSRILAQNYEVGFTDEDVQMYLQRVEESLPRSAEAAGMEAGELQAYLDQLRQKRQ